jgi:hypothetical protein
MIITFIVSFSALSAVRIYDWGLQGVWCDYASPECSN